MRCHNHNFLWSRQDISLAAHRLNVGADALLDDYFESVPENAIVFRLLSSRPCPFLSQAGDQCCAGDYMPIYCRSVRMQQEGIRSDW